MSLPTEVTSVLSATTAPWDHLSRQHVQWEDTQSTLAARMKSSASNAKSTSTRTSQANKAAKSVVPPPSLTVEQPPVLALASAATS